MFAVVLSKYKDIYMLRHIIYDIDAADTLESIKSKYYDIYNQTKTDEFFVCTSKDELNEILHRHGIKSAMI